MDVVTVLVGGTEVRVLVAPDGDVRGEGADTPASVQCVEPGVYSVIVGDRCHRVVAKEEGEGFLVLLGGKQYSITLETERTRLLRQYARSETDAHQRMEVHAPMPSLVSRILVQAGQEVAAGQPLLVLEAMKMENELRAHRAGTVSRVAVTPGRTVEKGQLLLIVE